MSIDLKTVKHISKLARISIDDEKANKLKGDLNNIFENETISRVKRLHDDLTVGGKYEIQDLLLPDYKSMGELSFEMMDQKDKLKTTKPDKTKSIVPCLLLGPSPNSISSLVSSLVCIITTGYCLSDNSSISKGCLVTFLIVGLDIPLIVEAMFDAIFSLVLIISSF